MLLKDVFFICFILQARVIFIAQSTLLSTRQPIKNLALLKEKTQAQVKQNSQLANKIDNEFEQLLQRPSRRKQKGGQSTASEVSKLRDAIMTDRDESKLNITDAARTEAARLRNELMRAVTHNSYAAKISKREGKNEIPMEPTTRRTFATKALPTASAPIRNENLATHYEIYSDVKHSLEEISVNVLDSSFDDNSEKPQRTFRHNRVHPKNTAHREVLEIVSVNDNDNFEFGENILAWKTLTKKIDDKHILVGISDQEVVLLTESNGNYDLVAIVDFKTKVFSFEVFPKYDADTKSVTGLVVVASKDLLTWFEITSTELKEIWHWNVQQDVVLLKYFEFKKADTLLLISGSKTHQGRASADIYEFDYCAKQYWIVQAIPLRIACTDITILDTGYDFLICFPQNNQTDIYNYQYDVHQRGKFSLQTSIQSHNVTNVAGFRIGGFSYLAIGGYHPQIFRYYRGRLRPQTILSQTFGLVERWLPIMTRTYRDDMILIVQHRLDFGSHFVSVLDALIWNGEAFDTFLSVPCHIREELVTFGISCMIDFRRNEGISGSTIIQRGKNISLLIPRQNAPSGLFDIKFQLTSAADPIREEIEHLRSVYEMFQEMIEQQDAIVLEAIEATVNGLKLDGDNVVTGNWNIETITATQVEQTENCTWKNNEIKFGNQPWALRETEIYLPAIQETLAEDEAMLFKLKEKSENLAQNDTKLLNIHDSLLVKGKVEIKGLLTTEDLQVASFGPEKVEQVLENIRMSRETKMPAALSLKTLNVHHLHIESLNNIPATDLMFNVADSLEFEKTLIFTNPLLVGEVVLSNGSKVNNVDFSEELVVMNVFIENTAPIVFEHVQISEDVVADNQINGVDLNVTKIREFIEMLPDMSHLSTNYLEINDNLDTATVNGVAWIDLLHGLVLQNLPNILEDVEVSGSVNVEESVNITVNNLNKLEFPDQYLLVNGPKESNISGRKNFTRVLRSSEIDCDGTIDGIDPFNIVTLSTNQKISGETKLQHIEVLQGLEVTGTIKGKHLDEFLTNPNLLMTKVIESACTFRQLEVQGPLYVENTMNDLDLDIVLADIVYTSDPTTSINSLKSFKNTTFEAGLTIDSKSLNDYKLNDFMTKNTDQKVQLEFIAGNVMFENIQVSGLFDYVNVTELDLSSIKLSGDQFTEAELNLYENGVVANNIHILETLNGYAAKDFLNIDEENEIAGEIYFDQIFADQLHHLGDILGDGSVNEVNLTHFDLYRLSTSRQQHISKPIVVSSGGVSEKFHSQHINGVEVKDFQHHAFQTENVLHLIYTGQIPIENLHVNGSVLINMLNDRNFEQLLESVVWLNRPNIIWGNTKFLDPITIDKNLTLSGFLNKQPFETFVDNLVLKNKENPIIVDGLKTFTKPIHVRQSLNTTKINSISVMDIVLKSTKSLSSKLHIYGNLTVDNLSVAGSLNEIPGEIFYDAYSYDSENEMHVLKSNAVFDAYVKIGDLHVTGLFNEIPDIKDFCSNILLKNETINATSEKLFLNDVHFDKGVDIDILNDVDISRIAEDLVFIDDDGSVMVEGDLIFKKLVSAMDIKVNEDVYTINLLGCDPDEWQLNGAMTNEPVVIMPPIFFPANKFSASNLEVVFLNNKPAADLITLHTDQYFNSTFTCDELTTINIQIGGTVNEYDIRAERDNTVMIQGDQEIKLPTSFQSVRILNSLHIIGNVNEKSFNKPALLRSDIHLQSPISFKNLNAKALITKDLISSIDFEHWYETALWKNGKDHQKIFGNWSVNKVISSSDIVGWSYINGYGMDLIVNNVEKSKEVLELALQKHHQQYSSLCQSLASLTKKSQEAVQFLKYFEFMFFVPQQNKINSIFTFSHHKNFYLIVNVGCSSGIYVWVPEKSKFKHIFQEDTGYVNNWIDVKDKKGSTYIVTQSHEDYTECMVQGSNIWHFEEATLKFHRSLGNSSEYYDLKGNPQNEESFYMLHRDNTVREFDGHGNHRDKWRLSSGTISGEYRFVPSDVDLGLALTNGKTLFVLSTAENLTELPAKKRKRRAAVRAVPKVLPQLSVSTSPSIWQRLMRTVVKSHYAVESLTFSNYQTDGHNEITTRSLLVKPEFYVTDPKNVKEFLKTQTLRPHVKSQSFKSDTVQLKGTPNFEFNQFLANSENIFKRRSEHSEALVQINMSATTQVEPKGFEETEPMHVNLLDSFPSTERSISIATTTEQQTITKRETPSTTTEQQIITTSDPVTTTVKMTEPTIGKTIAPGRVQIASNHYLPQKDGGEVLTLRVGIHGSQRTLVAVSMSRQNIIVGNNDVIQIFEDVLEGKLYQTLPCNRPSGLITINMKDETVLAFLEGNMGVQIYTYRGIQGFVPFASFKLASPASYMTAVSLPPLKPHKCATNYLAVVVEFNVLFYEAVICGDCLDVNLNCDIY